MIDLNILFALISYYFVMYVTPGPNNAMVLTSGLKFGFSKTIPHMTGITIGHVTQLIISMFWFRQNFSNISKFARYFKSYLCIYLF